MVTSVGPIGVISPGSSSANSAAAVEAPGATCRLEASFDAEKIPGNPDTRELINAISFSDEELVRDFGSWSKDRFAFEVFRESLNALLKHYEPKGEPVPAPNPDGLAELLFGENPSAEHVGRFLVGTWIREQPKRAFAERKKRS